MCSFAYGGATPPVGTVEWPTHLVQFLSQRHDIGGDPSKHCLALSSSAGPSIQLSRQQT